ncbi:MAG TPA: iron-sulfur cluster assembly protein [Acidimicrobiia bacterium]
MIGVSDVRAALDEVHDPCSEVAGVPAGIVEMGLVTHVTVEQSPAGAVVSLAIRVTEPTCLMGPSLASGARERVEALPGVARVDVTLSDDNEWMPSAMSPEYRARLAAHRAQRREGLEVRETALGAPMRIRP